MHPKSVQLLGCISLLLASFIYTILEAVEAKLSPCKFQKELTIEKSRKNGKKS